MKLRHDYDVVIVGAGPAGAGAARALTGSGLNTLIVERDRLPRYKMWKFLSATTAGYKSDEGKVKFLSWMDHLIVDSRRDYATIVSQLHPDTTLQFNAVLTLKDFPPAGFQK